MTLTKEDLAKLREEYKDSYKDTNVGLLAKILERQRGKPIGHHVGMNPKCKEPRKSYKQRMKLYDQKHKPRWNPYTHRLVVELIFDAKGDLIEGVNYQREYNDQEHMKYAYQYLNRHVRNRNLLLKDIVATKSEPLEESWKQKHEHHGHVKLPFKFFS